MFDDEWMNEELMVKKKPQDKKGLEDHLHLP